MPSVTSQERQAGAARRVLAPDGLFVVADVDTPTNWFGRLCLLGADLLFHQPEIRKNAAGLLPRLFPQAGFGKFSRVAGNLGYIATFLLYKIKRD